MVKEKDIFDTTSTCSFAAKLKAGLNAELLRSAMSRYCFIQNTSFDGLEKEYELEFGSVLTEKVSLVPADPSCEACSAQGHSSFAQNMLRKKRIEHAVSVIRVVTVFEAYSSIFRTDQMFYH